MSGVFVVIPSRWGSVRFPGKSLAMLAGKPMIQRVVERVRQARKPEAVIVATDDRRIAECVQKLNIPDVRVAMTHPDHPSGTDRTAEVISSIIRADYVINVQGDEPLIDPALVDELAESIVSGAWDMATAAVPIKETRQIQDTSVVKALFNRYGQALYFSRSVVPHFRDPDGILKPGAYWRHIGVYAYRRDCLLQLAAEPPCMLETFEKLEQLRALDMGFRIHVIKTAHSGIGVDTPEDAARIEKFLQKEIGA